MLREFIKRDNQKTRLIPSDKRKIIEIYKYMFQRQGDLIFYQIEAAKQENAFRNRLKQLKELSWFNQ